MKKKLSKVKTKKYDQKKNKSVGKDRRKHPRVAVLERFQLFLSVPKLGPHRIYLKDLSEGGVAFVIDEGLNFKSNVIFQGKLHINQSLSVPVSFKVVHQMPHHQSLLIGAAFNKNTPGTNKIIKILVQLVEALL